MRSSPTVIYLFPALQNSLKSAFSTLLNAQTVSGVTENKHLTSGFIKVWKEEKFKLLLAK